MAKNRTSFKRGTKKAKKLGRKGGRKSRPSRRR
jgi:hypothetical protein